MKRLDEVQRFATNVLALNPETGERIPSEDGEDADEEADTWGFVTAPWPRAPSVVIYYRFDEGHVYLIEMADADETADDMGDEEGEDGFEIDEDDFEEDQR